MELMESLAQLFYDEATETLAQMEQILLALEDGEVGEEAVHALFRGAHSLKGNSGTMGFTHISRFTHGIENALDIVRSRTATTASAAHISKPVADLLLRSVDVLRSMLETSKSDGDTPCAECAGIVSGLEAAVRSEGDATTAAPPAPASSAAPQPEPEAAAAPDEPAGRRFRVRYRPASELSAVHDPLRVLAEASEYVTLLACRFHEDVPALDDLHLTTSYCAWDFDIETAYEPVMVRAVLELAAEGSEVEIEPLTGEVPALAAQDAPDADAGDTAEQVRTDQPAVTATTSTTRDAAAPAPARKANDAQTIRVATEKVDALFNLTSEMVVAQSMLSATQSRIADQGARTTIAQMERHVRELHERVMAIRMVPVGYVFSRFPRLVRDLASSTGKEVRLEIAGEETELDRTLLESLVDPLTHLLRNAMDHGLETPDARVAAGKPPCGIVGLNAFQAEGRIHVEVTDDGRGIDTDRVRAKAIGLGWVREDEHLAPETVYDFLFRPGFSTAEKITDVSGRGVGMDVVKRNVEALGGAVAITSETGKGSRFTIKVPLTLAIMDGLTLRVGPEFYIVPLTSVIEAFQPDNVSICTALGGNEVANIRGKFLPLAKLSDVLDSDRATGDGRQGLLVILEQDGQQVAVLADEIIGQQQIVMKSLEANYRRVRGFSGATILGDGRVAMVIDVADIIRRSQNAQAA